MKRLVAIVTLVAATAACGTRGEAVDASAPAPAPDEPGTVVIPAGSPMLTEIKRAPVGEAELPTDEIVAPGKIDANPNHISKVMLPVAGRIATVLVKTGDAVAKDQPLLTIQSPDADVAMSAFLSARSAVSQAQAALTKAQADVERLSDLFAHNAVAAKDVLAAQNALAQGQAGLEQAQAVREQTVRRLGGLGLAPGDVKQEVVLRAPLAGKVLELSVVPGEFKNDVSASVMTIVDLRTVWVTSQVPETYIRFVQRGERVEISLVAYPGETFEGRISRIADTVDPQTRTVGVQAEVANPGGRFRPEMYTSIHHVESFARVAVVPASAIVQDGNRTVLFVEPTPGHFQERDVSVGKRAGSLVRVSSGVKPGDLIVVDGAMLLKGLMKRT